MSETINVRYNCANVRGLGPSYTLKPGDNAVPLDVFVQFQNHPEIVGLVESGDLEFLDDDDGDDEQPAKTASKAAGKGRGKAKAKAAETAEDFDPDAPRD